MINPGWVDLQVNGHNGVDYSQEGLTVEKFAKSIEELHATGTAIIVPTIITSPFDLIQKHTDIILEAVSKYGLQDIVPGVHLEGPMISPEPGAVGAHNPAYVAEATAENVEELYKRTSKFVKIITIAAEYPKAPEAIKKGVELGIHMSVGHHLADYCHVRAAADAGCELLTHLANGCPNLVGRHNNPIWSGLAEDRLTAMLITDGHHIPGDLLKVLFKVKGADKVIVTSDASSITGFPPGTYETLSNLAVLTPEGKLYNPEKQCLVGSASTMTMCMNFLESLEFLSEEELRKVGRDNALKLLGML